MVKLTPADAQALLHALQALDAAGLIEADFDDPEHVDSAKALARITLHDITTR